MKRNTLKKVMAAIAVVLSVNVALVGCAKKASDGAAVGSTKDTLVVAQGSDAKSLDPHATNDSPSSRVAKQIYDRLVEADENMNIVAGLADKWTRVDDTTWEFNLKKGVKFHNGEELKASDVVFTLKRMQAANTVKHIIDTVKEVTAKDEYTVVIETKFSFAPLLSHLAHTASSILNEKAVTEAGENYGQKPVGTGAYKLVGWEAGSKITLEANDQYHGQKAKIKTVVFRNIVEGTNRTIGLETGEVDIAYDVEPIDKEKVKTHKNLQLIEGESLGYAYIGMNTKKAPLDNVKVRQAINHAIDKQIIIDTVLNGAGTVANAPIAPKVFGYSKDLKGYEYNVQKAKDLLKEAGQEGMKTSIWTNDNPVRVQIAQIVQAQLKEVGIDATIQTLEWASYLDRTAKGEHDMYILAWTTVTGDADYALHPLYHTSSHGGAGNRTFFSNPEIDKMLDDARVSTDEKERLALYKKAMETIIAAAPDAMLYYTTQNVGAQKSVEGFKLHPAGHHKISSVSFK
jgi:peptide/nickel transport system substrate-binding protein